MYLLKFETKSVQFEPLVSLCSFNSFTNLCIKSKWLNSKKIFEEELKSWLRKKTSFHKKFWSIYHEVLSATWPNFTVVKYNLQTSHIHHHIEFRESIMNRSSIKKLSLKILQYSYKNTCVGVSFNKNTSLQSCNFIKKRLQYNCFPVNIANF